MLTWSGASLRRFAINVLLFRPFPLPLSLANFLSRYATDAVFRIVSVITGDPGVPPFAGTSASIAFADVADIVATRSFANVLVTAGGFCAVTSANASGGLCAMHLRDLRCNGWSCLLGML